MESASAKPTANELGFVQGIAKKKYIPFSQPLIESVGENTRSG